MKFNSVSLNTVLAKIAGADEEALVEIDKILKEGVVNTKEQKSKEEFLSIKEACALTCSSRSHLWKQIKNGVVETCNFGNRVLISREALIKSIMKTAGTKENI